MKDIKHPKEYKQKNEDITGSKSFTFGKKNNFYIINLALLFLSVEPIHSFCFYITSRLMES